MDYTTLDTQHEVYKTALAKLREIYRKRKEDFLKDHKRSLKDEERSLQKKFGYKEFNLNEAVSTSEKKAKNHKKNSKKKSSGRGSLKPRILEIATKLAEQKMPLTVGNIKESFATEGEEVKRQQIYLILHREVGKTLRLIKSGKGGEETIFGLMEK